MADAKKCDRCGNIYMKRKSEKLFGIVIKANDDVIDIVDTERNTTKRFDLCDKCIDEFKEKFMKGIGFVEVPQPESND